METNSKTAGKKLRSAFLPGGVPYAMHLYTRCYDEGVVFYTQIDRLVFYTAFAVAAKRFGLTVLELVLMFTHFHACLENAAEQQVESLMESLMSMYVLDFNNYYGREGPLFCHRFGRSFKVGEKAIRTNIAYCGNNPCEKKLCNSAREYRWNFLQYGLQTNPYSGKPKKLSYKLTICKRIVDNHVLMCNFIRFKTMHRLFKGLDGSGSKWLADYIISAYRCVDYQELASYYGSYETMLDALDNNTGSEYDFRETRYNFSDSYYEEMVRRSIDLGLIGETGGIMSLTEECRRQWADFFLREYGFSKYQVEKFFHIAY